MGVTILVEGERVTVDIPTYGKMWGAGYFYGSLTGMTFDNGGSREFNSPFEEGSGAGESGSGGLSGFDAGGGGRFHSKARCSTNYCCQEYEAYQ